MYEEKSCLTLCGTTFRLTQQQRMTSIDRQNMLYDENYHSKRCRRASGADVCSESTHSDGELWGKGQKVALLSIKRRRVEGKGSWVEWIWRPAELTVDSRKDYDSQWMKVNNEEENFFLWAPSINIWVGNSHTIDGMEELLSSLRSPLPNRSWARYDRWGSKGRKNYRIWFCRKWFCVSSFLSLSFLTNFSARIIY